MKKTFLFLFGTLVSLILNAQKFEILWGDQKVKGTPNTGAWAWKTETGYAALTANSGVLSGPETKYLRYSENGSLISESELKLNYEGHKIILVERIPVKDKLLFWAFSQKINALETNYYTIEFIQNGETINPEINVVDEIKKKAGGPIVKASSQLEYTQKAQFGFSPDGTKLIVQTGLSNHEMALIDFSSPRIYVLNTKDYGKIWDYAYSLPDYRSLNPIVTNDGTAYVNFDRTSSRKANSIKQSAVKILKIKDGKVVSQMQPENPEGKEIFGSNMIYQEGEDALLVIATQISKKGVMGFASLEIDCKSFSAEKWQLTPFSKEVREILLGDKNKAENGFDGVVNPIFIKKLSNGNFLYAIDMVFAEEKTTSYGTTTELYNMGTVVATFSAAGEIQKQICIENRIPFLDVYSNAYTIGNLSQFTITYRSMIPYLNEDKLHFIFNAQKSFLDEKNSIVGKNSDKKSPTIPIVITIDLNTGKTKRSEIISKNEVKPNKFLVATGYHSEFAANTILFNIDANKGNIGLAFVEIK